MNTRRIDENNLAARTALLLRHIEDSEDAITGSLRLGADNSDFLSYQRVEQGRFAGVRPAQDTDESGMKAHEMNTWGRPPSAVRAQRSWAL